MPRGLRAATGAGVDGRFDALVRGAARHGLVHRPLPRAPRRDHAAARLLGGRARRGPEGRGAPGDEPGGRRPGVLPSGRDPAAPRSARRSRGGLPQRQRAGPGASARARLLRLAQGNEDAAAAALRRVLGESTEPTARGLLPAFVEVMLAAGEVDEAERASTELEAIAAGYEEGTLPASAARARGAVALARGEAQSALTALREAERTWHELEAPYESARAGARGTGLPGARRRGHRSTRAGGGAGSSSSWEQRRTLPASASRSPNGTASRTASSRCCGWSRRGRATARSPQRSSSASTQSPVTSRTSSGSWASRHAPRPARSRSSTVSCDAPAWSILTTRRGSQLVDPGDAEPPGRVVPWVAAQFPIRRSPMSTTMTGLTGLDGAHLAVRRATRRARGAGRRPVAQERGHRLGRGRPHLERHGREDARPRPAARVG